MSHVAWSACLCVGHTDVLCKKTAEPIEMPFEVQILVLQGTMYIRWGQVGDAAFC